ncbi:ankyrin-2 [Dendroctonus ponderosae]
MSDSDSGRESSLTNYRPQVSYNHPKLIDNDQNTKLHIAAASNQVALIEKYIRQEFHFVDPQNYLGWTPLMMACRKGHFDSVRCLILHRANATLVNAFGTNVFQLGVASGNLEMVKFLLDHFLTGGISRRILELFLPVASIAILFKHQKILEFLVEHHFSVDGTTPETGITPFMFAHAMENDPAISYLLKQNADTTIKNFLGITAIHIATIRQHMKVLPTIDQRYFSQKLSHLPPERQESFTNEMQNQQLRSVLQMKSEGTPNYLPPQVCGPNSPFIIVTSCSNTPDAIKFEANPNRMGENNRRSSNISPSQILPSPNLTPIFPNPSIRQIFFPSNFSFPQNYLISPSFTTVPSHHKNDILNENLR